MIRYLKSTWNVFWRYRHLLANLVSRDIKVKYRRSVLGLAWSVLNPLLMMMVMTLVFGKLFSDLLDNAFPIVAATGQPPPFAIYVLTGQLIFAFFSDSTSMAMDSVLGNAQLIKKVYIPKYIFPLEKVLFSMVNTLFSMLSLVLVMLVLRFPVSFWVLLAPAALALLFLFNLGVGLILSAGVVFFRDIKHLYSVFILALTYMTPVFWSETILDGSLVLETIVKLNPMYWFVSLFRWLVVYGRAPTPLQWLIPAGCAVGSLLIGLLMFRKTQDDFILHI
ncbi:ABC transporter permease [Ruminococcaceae bacterium OttesenSCG-928-D13]|nr:ABC transporter permease [Ruminococcaceae bacterium OttesenSCG-928-D13]